MTKQMKQMIENAVVNGGFKFDVTGDNDLQRLNALRASFSHYCRQTGQYKRWTEELRPQLVCTTDEDVRNILVNAIKLYNFVVQGVGQAICSDDEALNAVCWETPKRNAEGDYRYKLTSNLEAYAEMNI